MKGFCTCSLMAPGLAVLLVVLAGGCSLLVDDQSSRGGKGEGEGEGEGEVEGEGEGEVEGGGEGEGEGEGGGEGEGEGEGGGEGEGEGEGEGAAPGPVTLQQVVNLQMPGAWFYGTALSADERWLTTGNYGAVWFFSMEDPIPERPDRIFDIDDFNDIDHLLSGYTLHPFEPLLVTLAGGVDLATIDFGGDRFVQLAIYDETPIVGLSGPYSFNAAGDRLAFAATGKLAVFQVIPTLQRLFLEVFDLPDLERGQAVFYGQEDRVAFLESKRLALLRLLQDDGDDTWSKVRTLQLDATAPECDEVGCLAGAAEVDRLAVCCSRSGLLLVEDPQGEARKTQLRGGIGPFTAAALSRDGQLVAATAGDRIYVWQALPGAQVATAEPGPAPDNGPAPTVAFSSSGRYLAVDRDHALVVYEVIRPLE